MLNKLQQTNKEKEKIQVREQVLYNIAKMLDHFPQYRIAQHFTFLMRRRSTEGPQPFDWEDKEFLKRLEKYNDELETELSLPVQEEND